MTKQVEVFWYEFLVNKKANLLKPTLSQQLKRTGNNPYLNIALALSSKIFPFCVLLTLSNLLVTVYCFLANRWLDTLLWLLFSLTQCFWLGWGYSITQTSVDSQWTNRKTDMGKAVMPCGVNDRYIWAQWSENTASKMEGCNWSDGS